MSVSLLVISKAPRPGRSKTRLCPPCSPEEAAGLAEAALLDTLDAADRTPGLGRRVLVLDGAWAPPPPAGWETIAQHGDGLARRIANAFADVGGPALLVGMDTPQLSASLLARSIARLVHTGVEAVLGPAFDGGFWAIGLREPNPDVFTGVPMSTSRTCAAQRRRLRSLSIPFAELPRLRDVDTFGDALSVAKLAPRTRFADAMGCIGGNPITLADHP